MANTEERATDRAASVTVISSNNDTASESAAVGHSETTSEYQHSGDSEEITVGSSKKPVAIDTPQDMSDESESREGSQAAFVAEPAEKNGKKRAGEEQDEGKQSKKAKFGEGNGSGQGDEGAGEVKKPETMEELRALANERIKLHQARNKELNEALQGMEEKLNKVEEERDEWRGECVNLKKKDETRIANKNQKEKNEKAHRSAVRAEDKKLIRADVEKDLQDKYDRAEKKLRKELNTKVKNMSNDIEHKREKIDSLTEDIRNLKSNHKEEIRGLKEKLKEAQKEGGPRAIEKLKQKELELKEKEKEAQDWKRLRIEMANSITKLNSEVNAAKTGEQQSQAALDNTFHENDALQANLAAAKREVASWKANAMHANNNGEIRERQWQAKFKQTTKNYHREIDSVKQRAKACNDYQQAARDLNRRNDRNNELRLEDARKLADTENKLQLALIEKDRAKASEETLRAEQQKFAEENKRLREVFAQANISPLAVLTSSTADSASAEPTKGHGAGQNFTAINGTRAAEKSREAAQNGTSASKSNSWAFPNGI